MKVLWHRGQDAGFLKSTGIKTVLVTGGRGVRVTSGKLSSSDDDNSDSDKLSSSLSLELES